jgi:hypothetical protein
MSIKATHKGECQICGHVQKLPGGNLSKHGYTKRWGFFSGVCHGAGYLPFEVSKDQIAGAVVAVESKIAAVESEIADLENILSAVNSGDEAMANEYVGNSRYCWEKVRVINFKVQEYPASGSCEAFVTYKADSQIIRKDGYGENAKYFQPRDINAYSECFNLSSVRHWVHFLNCKYAKHLRSQNSARRDWVKWQQDRLANWAPKPLTPLAK